jgi:hypothetical protein
VPNWAKIFGPSPRIEQTKIALLEQRALLRLPGKETFVVAEAFKVGGKIGGRTLSAIGWNFSEYFLGVTENPKRTSQAVRLSRPLRRKTNVQP